jgi:hypothetical protein
MILFLKPCPILACSMLLIIAPCGADAQAQMAQTPPSSAPARTIIDLQLHAVDAKTPDRHVTGMEADAIYQHYLADIGRPLTRDNGGSQAQSQNSTPTASGGH